MCRMALLLLVQATAQLYSSGVGKATHCVSNAPAALNWLMEHLPVAKDEGGFDSCQDEEYCPCGQVGRVELLTPPQQHGLGFGLHTVHTNSSSRRPLGSLPIEAIEGNVTERLRAAAETASYDPLLDLNTGFWVGDLDPYVERLAGARTLPIEWRDPANNDTVYYSLLVQVAGSYVLLELMSANQTTLPSPRYHAPQPRFRFQPGQRPPALFGDLNATDPASGLPLLHPARLSQYSSEYAAPRRDLP